MSNQIPRPHDTKEYRASLNAQRKARQARLATFLAAYDSGSNNLHEVYFKNEKGDVTKAGECRGTRRQQVAFRRMMRAKLNVGADRLVLYTNGQLRKCGIDKK